MIEGKTFLFITTSKTWPSGPGQRKMALPHFEPCFYIMPIRPRPRTRSVILFEDEYEDEYEDDITETDDHTPQG
jgi:hypothetical protein